MSIRSLLGLLVLNAFVLAVGCGLLWGLRGWRSWQELARLSGLGYMLGLGGLGIAFMLELVLSVPFTLVTILLTGVTLAAAGVVAGTVAGRSRPVLREPGTGGLGVLVATFAALVAVYLEALFRAGRLQGLYAFDAWSFWVPKAKMLYFFDGIDVELLDQLANPTYPPIVPALEAAAFTFMGSPDVVTLHLQFWFFLVGFSAAIVGMLSSRVRPLFLWPLLLLVLVAPRIVGRTLEPQADFLLDYFFSLAAVLFGLWLVERKPWQLACGTLFLAATMLTKREGQLLAVCIALAAFVASSRDIRFAWPRLALANVAAFGLALPWRIWFSSQDLTGEFPPRGGPLDLLENAERAWPALRSVARSVFEYQLWLIVPVVALAAIGLAFLAGARVLPVYATLVYGFAASGFVWVLWAFTEYELPLVQDEAVNPIVRLTAGLMVLTAALGPLLLETAWRGSATPVGEDRYT